MDTQDKLHIYKVTSVLYISSRSESAGENPLIIYICSQIQQGLLSMGTHALTIEVAECIIWVSLQLTHKSGLEGLYGQEQIRVWTSKQGGRGKYFHDYNL